MSGLWKNVYDQFDDNFSLQEAKTANKIILLSQ
jgi:hypothetical protein